MSDGGRMAGAQGWQGTAPSPASAAAGDAVASKDQEMGGWLGVASSVYVPPVRLVGWIANALGASMSRLGSELSGDESDTGLPTAPFVIADRSMTRC